MGVLKSRHVIGLITLSSLLLSLAWPYIGSLPFLIFIGFIPLFYLQDYYEKSHPSSKRIFFPMFVCFLIWNISTTWFIFMIKLPGSTPWEEFVSRITASGLTYVLNAIFMSIVFWLFHYCKRSLGPRLGYLSLIVFWLSFEYIHMHWDINWPWLNLGNVFADNSWLIQWYEYTGVPGGSLWILLVNIVLYRLWSMGSSSRLLSGAISDLSHSVSVESEDDSVQDSSIKELNDHRIVKSKQFKGSIIMAGLLILVPTIVSLFMYNAHVEKGEEISAIALQPNVDPYNEKFEVDPLMQLEDMLELADSILDNDVSLLVFPETALLENSSVSNRGEELIFTGLWEGHYEETFSVKAIRKLAEKYPDLMIVVGLSDRRAFGKHEEITLTARYIEGLDLFYDSYNSLIGVKDGEEVSLYRKSKLVPGVESVPFGKLMKKIEAFALDLGGTTGSLGTQKERTNFTVSGNQIGAMVCYESIFGEFVTEYVKNGAQALSISTNDSWWQESPGYKQLLAYARLRAIENRRSIIRSANTGISCFIDQKGDIVNHTSWWVKTALPGALRINNELTFYTKHGDFISRIASLLAVILLLYSFVRNKKKGTYN